MLCRWTTGSSNFFPCAVIKRRGRKEGGRRIFNQRVQSVKEWNVFDPLAARVCWSANNATLSTTPPSIKINGLLEKRLPPTFSNIDNDTRSLMDSDSRHLRVLFICYYYAYLCFSWPISPSPLPLPSIQIDSKKENIFPKFFQVKFSKKYREIKIKTIFFFFLLNKAFCQEKIVKIQIIFCISKKKSLLSSIHIVFSNVRKMNDL